MPHRGPDRGQVGGTRRRFVQEGQVPVVIVNREAGDAPLVGRAARTAAALPERLRDHEAALAAEQLARQRAERALQDAQAIVHELRTKLGHAELARQELESQRAASAAALTRMREERDTALAELATLKDSVAAAADPLRAERKPRAASPGRPRRNAAASKEPQPVKWWLKSASWKG
jgi:hypothetical protein